MKTHLATWKKSIRWSLALAAVFSVGHYRTLGLESRTGETSVQTEIVSPTTNRHLIQPVGGSAHQSDFSLKHAVALDLAGAGDPARRKEVPWLGIASEEAPEVVTAQLGLNPGVGLVVTYVTPDSPAAKSGVQKNDLLVQFDDQSLVLPEQLRKLVQVRKEGDTVKLTFYRAGKQQSVSATLGKTIAASGVPNEQRFWMGDLRNLGRQLKDLPLKETIQEQIKNLHESLGHAQIDKKKVQEELRHSMEQARKVYQEALQHATNANSALGPVRKALEQLAKSRLSLDKNATVTVRSTGQSVKSIVKADESGTIVVVNRPKLHLTAHDKDGKLLFDGEIETSAQRDKVPHEIWHKVEPLLDKITPKAEDPEMKSVPSKETL